MNISRGITHYDFLAKKFQNSWQENTLNHIRRTSEITLGIVGAGRIGGSVIRKANAIGFNTIFYDPYKERGYEKMLNSMRVESLEELLEKSDVVTLHCPLNKETHGLINENTIKLMKRGSSIVNTARGGLIYNDLILNALIKGDLTYCAIDVLTEEPPDEKDVLIEAWKNSNGLLGGRLLINPHTSYYSQQSISELRINAAKNALRILNKLEPYNMLNQC